MEEVKKLIEALNEMFNTVEPIETPYGKYFIGEYDEGYLKEKTTPENIEKVNAAESLTGCLISEHGGLDSAARKELSDAGYSIIVLESDSFGPLVCGIIKESRRNGILSFG